ncbi:putative type IV restriction endonuclease [Deinococcus sp. HSC-46F16]|uniref:DUF4357 domain-containing protein n=1 Tax=Deinococcus sp. HSC-46F16 TaxID=2910968 RepID=UPI00209E89C3|nr:DUF4357 domain-containing protein [Deinococcus sp. HSC-46F16]MCP2015491.1 putative type IV restriction endonuclease [Deinococcus sp. HSC-46F16]
MPSPIARLRDAVNDIQGWLVGSPNSGEAVVRQAIVLRLLQAAGFDIWNPAEVVPEETNATGNRADFLIRAGTGKFALEIKGMGVTLGAVHFQQAATYAVNEGTRWAVVTNGRVWTVIDEHLPGWWEERVALRVELGQEGDTFAADLATLLDAETWRADAFAGAVETVRQRQHQRRDEARIQREKRPIVEAIQARYQIPTFELAAENAVEAGKITEAERDVLLGNAPTEVMESWTPDGDEDLWRENYAVGYRINFTQRLAHLPTSLGFTYSIKGAQARVCWETTRDVWVVKKGSTALDRVLASSPDAAFIQGMRDRLLREGALRRIDGSLLEYVKDVEYSSASMSASQIAGGTRNGWRCWKDPNGRPASYWNDIPKTETEQD